MSKPTSRTAAFPAALLKGLTLFHRWVGVVLCAMFAVWFATGAVMAFVAFPALPAPDKARLAAPIDLSRLRVGPQEAARWAGPDADIRLVSRLGEPAYVARSRGARDRVLSGETRRPPPPVSPDDARRIAARFGRADAVNVSGPFDYDQWVVHQQFDPLRPFYRVRLNDGRGGDYYVSAATGEVAQRTFAYERAWNWLGSVIHWIYLTPIRKSFPVWDWLVWSISLVGLTTTLAGLWLGVTRTQTKMRSKRPSISPFRGLLRWHHILGLVGGGFVLCWITSGWLSMDHGKLFSQGVASAAQLAAYRGAADPTHRGFTPEDLRRLAPATSVSFTQVAGHPVASATGADGNQVLISEAGGMRLDHRVPAALIAAASEAAWPGEGAPSITAVPADGVYAKAESLPASALEIRPSGAGAPRIYVDGASGKILVVMDRSREAYAWVYYVLHTYNFPGLTSRPALRITLLLIPLGLGLAFSITGVLTGIRRLRLTARI